MEITEYLRQEKSRIEAFERWWISQNKLNPEEFPLEIPDDNNGVLGEQIANFDELICGDSVVVTKESLTKGKEGIIDEEANLEGKLKVDFDEQWCGYFFPQDLEYVK